MSKPVVIFDLDDTLCDTSALRDGIYREPEAMQARIATASPLPRVREALALASTHRIIIMTARNDRSFTREQVASFGIDAEFLFRPEGDNRQDWKVKADHTRALIAAGENIVAAFDDKAKNVEMFRSFGIEAVQV